MDLERARTTNPLTADLEAALLEPTCQEGQADSGDQEEPPNALLVAARDRCDGAYVVVPYRQPGAALELLD
jgi:hypothetical protein